MNIEDEKSVTKLSPKKLGVLLCGLALAVGCGDSDAAGDDGGTGAAPGGGSGPSQCGGADSPFVVVANEANNYQFSSSIELAVQKVAPRTLLDFDWGGVTKNFQGHAVDPTTDIQSMVLIVWNLSPEEVAQKINDDAPDIQAHIQASVQFVTGGATSASLGEFSAFGSEVTEETYLEYLDPDVNDPATHCYTLMAQSGTNLGQDVEMIQAFQVDTTETSTEVVMSDASTHLEWSTDLEALTPTVVPAGSPDVVVDWSSMKTHGYGGDFVPNQITEILIGRLGLSVQEIEADFLNLEFIADDIWRSDVTAGTSFNLGDLAHEEDGSAFPGVTAGETWVMGLLCSTCTNPTPWYITTVETCP